MLVPSLDFYHFPYNTATCQKQFEALGLFDPGFTMNSQMLLSTSGFVHTNPVSQK